MNARDRLAGRQAALLRALLAGDAGPEGFDVARLQAERDTLLAKRRRVIGYLRPDLATALGDRFAGLFDSYAAHHPRTAGTGARADASAFERWLAGRGELPRRGPFTRLRRGSR